jgi:hypothetical protein
VQSVESVDSVNYLDRPNIAIRKTTREELGLPGRIILSVNYTICAIVIVICSYINIGYIKRKALGMQTFRDQMMIEVQRCIASMAVYGFFWLIVGQLYPFYYGPVNEHLVLVVCFLGSILLTWCYLQCGVFLLVKIISIYQPILLEVSSMNYFFYNYKQNTIFLSLVNCKK